MNKLFTFLCLLLLTASIWAQSPEKMSYQAVVRDEGNKLLINRPVGAKMSILQGSEKGKTVYSEVFNPNPETNANGLLTLEIGGGNPVSGTFAEIEWSKGPFFVQTEIDPSGGSNYSVTGTSQLLSVPYALHAKTAENVDDADNDPTNELQELSLNGTMLSLSRGGGSVNLPSSGSGDNWGTQSVVSDATLEGAGTSGSPLKLADNAVTSTKIVNGAVTGSKIAQAGASSGQVLKWDGSTWSPGDDEAGEGGLTLPYSGIDDSYSSVNSFSISAQGTAIFGESLNTSDADFNIGVYGKALLNQWSRGVFGEGAFAGVWGKSNGYGVYGEGYTGVYGNSSSSFGTAIRGYSSSTTGTTFGVLSEVRSNSGFSGHFKGGKFYVEGKVGLGTESPVTSLHVRHGVLATNAPEPVEGIRIHNSGANNNSWTLYTVNSNGNLQFYANNELRGTFSATSGTYTSSSNRRLKTDITALGEDILKRTLQLEPVSYRFIRNPQSEPTIGFIAEDVHPLFPELVEVTGETDENLGVNYAAFSVVAIKAIQQQQKQMEALQTENEQLKKRLERLEQIVASTAEKGN